MDAKEPTGSHRLPDKTTRDNAASDKPGNTTKMVSEEEITDQDAVQLLEKWARERPKPISYMNLRGQNANGGRLVRYGKGFSPKPLPPIRRTESSCGRIEYSHKSRPERSNVKPVSTEPNESI